MRSVELHRCQHQQGQLFKYSRPQPCIKARSWCGDGKVFFVHHLGCLSYSKAPYFRVNHRDQSRWYPATTRPVQIASSVLDQSNHQIPAFCEPKRTMESIYKWKRQHLACQGTSIFRGGFGRHMLNLLPSDSVDDPPPYLRTPPLRCNRFLQRESLQEHRLKSESFIPSTTRRGCPTLTRTVTTEISKDFSYSSGSVLR